MLKQEATPLKIQNINVEISGSGSSNDYLQELTS